MVCCSVVVHVCKCSSQDLILLIFTNVLYGQLSWFKDCSGYAFLSTIVKRANFIALSSALSISCSLASPQVFWQFGAPTGIAPVSKGHNQSDLAITIVHDQ